jgi:protein-disulfide isomerase
MSPVSGTDPDLTRKERREQARADRRAVEAATAAQQTRRRRLYQLCGVILVAAAIIAVIVLATGGGKKEGLATSKHEINSNVTAVSSLIGGLPQSGNNLGSPNAPVTMQYFGDLECPICKEFTLGALPAIIKKYVRAGKLKIEYHSMETATREKETFHLQQTAALAAGKQDRAWYYVELFYHEQGQEGSGYVTESYLQGLAQQVPGLNLADWSAARNDPTFAEQLTRDEQTVTQQGFTGTPSFLLGKSGGHMEKLETTGFEEPGSFEAAINKLLT